MNTTQQTRPRLVSPPLIDPASHFSGYTVTASDGKRYRLTPSGVRSFQADLNKPLQKCVTFSYRRIDYLGKPIERIRMSKKNHLRLKRAVNLTA